MRVYLPGTLCVGVNAFLVCRLFIVIIFLDF